MLPSIAEMLVTEVSLAALNTGPNDQRVIGQTAQFLLCLQGRV